jgi:hypothetical protein
LYGYRNKKMYNVLVCDILPEGILGQNFLLKYVLKIDNRKLCLCLETMEIPCWIGGMVTGINNCDSGGF